MTSRRKTGRIIFFLLALACLVTIVYLPLAGFGYVNYDDPLYVRDNSMVNGGLTLKGIVWAFTTTHAANWHPLAWLSHMLDISFLGQRPGAHHMVSVALHLLSSVTLMLVLARMTGSFNRCALVAVLFAVHPLHVESVAWLSERKDVLAAFLVILSLAAYLAYLHRPNQARFGSDKVRQSGGSRKNFGGGSIVKARFATSGF